MHQAETRRVAVGPFEIVEQAPMHVAEHGHTAIDRVLQPRQRFGNVTATLRVIGGGCLGMAITAGIGSLVHISGI